MNIYMALNGKQIKNDWKKGRKASLESDPEDKDLIKKEELILTPESNIEDCYFDPTDNEINVSFSNKYGFFTIRIPLTDHIGHAIIQKYRNDAAKLKSLLSIPFS